MNAIKGIQGKDGPLLMDFSGVANVPGAVKSIADLKAKAGDHFEVDTVGPDGTIQTVRAVEKPAGGGEDSGQNVANPWTTAAIGQLIGILKTGHYRSDQTDAIAVLEALLMQGDEAPAEGVVQSGSVLTIISGVTVTQDGGTLNIA